MTEKNLESKTGDGWEDEDLRKKWVCIIIGDVNEGKIAYDLLVNAGFYVNTVEAPYADPPVARVCGKRFYGLNEIKCLVQKLQDLGSIDALINLYDEDDRKRSSYKPA